MLDGRLYPFEGVVLLGVVLLVVVAADPLARGLLAEVGLDVLFAGAFAVLLVVP